MGCRTRETALANLAESLFTFLKDHAQIAEHAAAEAIIRDWQRTGRKGVPAFLEAHEAAAATKRLAPKRQARHLSADVV